MDNARLEIKFEDGDHAVIVIVVFSDGSVEIKGQNVTSANAPEFRRALQAALVSIERQQAEHE